MVTHRRRAILVLISTMCFFTQVASLQAGDKSARSLELFEKHVRPTLLSECIRCHGPDKQHGGLRLDSREAVRTGGDSGPAVIVGDATASLLIQAIRYEDSALEMPPRGKLPASTIAGITEWVATGAADPRVLSSPSLGSSDETEHESNRIESGKKFWCFQPVRDTLVPTVSRKDWPRSEIDHFVLQPLETAGISPNPPADRATLLRRVYYDLIGLPPTPQQVLDFVNSRNPNAYGELVDQLLDSPQFGERWGRHWLDVVRYAESSGGGRTLLFPNAWRYRDYVIDAFNSDMPYDQFVREQIAGDLLEYDDWKDRRRKLVATAFLLLGPTNYELQDKDILEMDVVDEQIDTLGKAMLGMTIGCARCHDHKFDPIPAEDYYAMAGILRSTKAMIHSNVSTWNKVKLPMEASKEASYAKSEKRLAKLEKRLAKLKKKDSLAASLPSSRLSGIVVDNQSADLVGRWVTSSVVSRYVDGSYIHDEGVDRGTKRVIFRTTVPVDGDYEVRVSYSAGGNRSSSVPVKVVHANGDSTVLVNQKRKPKIQSLFHSLGVFAFKAAVKASISISNDGTSDGVVIADAIQLVAVGESSNEISNPLKEDRPNQQAVRDEIKSLKSQIAKLKEENVPRPIAMATADDDDASDIHLAIRGVVHNKGPVIRRGVLRVAADQAKLVIPEGESGRRELARWVTDPANPLTSRVFVNRVWHWLMGRGLVSTVDNFGSMGTKPTHPELLDHLASRFITEGWSTKQLIRYIMLSRVYQMGSAGNSRSEKLDPSNRLIWRMNRKRLDAESIRDSLLFAGGNLDMTLGGQNIRPGTKSEYDYEFTSTRRSVYVPVFRNTLPELFEVFDFADPNTQRGSRSESVIASQALLLMNQPFVMEQAERAAKRLAVREFSSNDARLDQVFLQVLGRTPAPEERAITRALLDKAEADKVIALSTIYQSLFSCIDFRYTN